MSRGLSSPQQTASSGRHRQVALLIEMIFDSGTLRLTTAPWDVIVGADTYVKSNRPGYIKPISESAGSVEGLEFGLSGLNTGFVDIAAGEPAKGRVVKLYKLYLDADSNQAIGSPVLYWVGRIRSMPIVESNSEASITVQVEHYDAQLSRPAPLRYNNADQQRLYAGDLGCEFAEEMAEKKIVWPHREVLMR
jgi:hypothetical protein